MKLMWKYNKFVNFFSFDSFGTENDEVYGAVLKNPTFEEDESRKTPDEFGLLSRILYKNDMKR